jgi:hypothetical protein
MAGQPSQLLRELACHPGSYLRRFRQPTQAPAISLPFTLQDRLILSLQSYPNPLRCQRYGSRGQHRCP